MGRASGGANNIHPLRWRGTNGKDPNYGSIMVFKSRTIPAP